VMAGPEMHIKTAQSGMLSQDGRCFTFDQRANGFVPGEGVGVIMLKRLEDAQRDQDNIYGVLQGWGVNQDGKTNGITAPNAESQTRLQQSVYDKYQIDPADIQLIEAHGTGTKLGDPIEVDALKQSFKKYTQKTDYCALGSVKSNIGHCLTAAGVAGVIKLLLALKHKKLPPTINYNQLNEHINIKESPFYINDQLQDWDLKDAQRRQAAISAFGFSGTNAHIVIAEYQPPLDVKEPALAVTPKNKVIVPLSSRTLEQLKQKAQDLLDFIHKEGSSINLIEMAYTLQTGREAMEERLGFMVSSIDQLAEKLQFYMNGDENREGIYQGQVKLNKEGLSIISQDDDMKEAIIDKSISQNKIFKLLELWVKGLEIDWNKLYGEIKPGRTSLPLYPFAKERYWIDAVDTTQQSVFNSPAAVLHPLLHTNTSDLIQQSYSSTFSGEEFFLKDHQIRTDGLSGQKVLPGVAYLEMARIAVEQALPSLPELTIELRNTTWLQPIVVEGQKQVSIALYADDVEGRLNEQIEYEIYSQDNEEEIVHCEGQALFVPAYEPVKLDLSQLKTEMASGTIESTKIYEAFNQMGLHYGPAHQGITSIFLGENQLLAQLSLPTVVEASQNDFLLHPSLMDGALQSSIGLIEDLTKLSAQPSVPFALVSLRLISACTKEMFAWVRYSQGSKPKERVSKLDIDLCDQEGNVCVQIRGFTSRALAGEIQSFHDKTIQNSSFDDAYYDKLIESVINKEISINEAVELG